MLQLSSNAYLLLGVPLTAAFQLLVRRRPLRELFGGKCAVGDYRVTVQIGVQVMHGVILVGVVAGAWVPGCNSWFEVQRSTRRMRPLALSVSR